MNNQHTYYVTCSDDEHDGALDTFTSLFDATCAYYELQPLLEGNEVGELGELLPDDEMEGFLFSMPEDR